MTNCFVSPVDSDDDSSESLCRSLIRANGVRLATDEEMDADFARVVHRCAVAKQRLVAEPLLSQPPTLPPSMKPLQLYSPPVRPMSPPARPLVVHPSPLGSMWPPLPPIIFQATLPSTAVRSGSTTVISTMEPVQRRPIVQLSADPTQRCEACECDLLVSSIRNHWWSMKHNQNIVNSKLERRYCVGGCYKLRAADRKWVTHDEHVATMARTGPPPRQAHRSICRGCGGLSPSPTD